MVDSCTKALSNRISGIKANAQGTFNPRCRGGLFLELPKGCGCGANLQPGVVTQRLSRSIYLAIPIHVCVCCVYDDDCIPPIYVCVCVYIYIYIYIYMYI